MGKLRPDNVMDWSLYSFAKTRRIELLLCLTVKKIVVKWSSWKSHQKKMFEFQQQRKHFTSKKKNGYNKISETLGLQLKAICEKARLALQMDNDPKHT